MHWYLLRGRGLLEIVFYALGLITLEGHPFGILILFLVHFGTTFPGPSLHCMPLPRPPVLAARAEFKSVSVIN